MAPLEQYVLDNAQVSDRAVFFFTENIFQRVVSRYKGKNTSYKIFNEATHGNTYRRAYSDIWNKVINIVQSLAHNSPKKL